MDEIRNDKTKNSVKLRRYLQYSVFRTPEWVLRFNVRCLLFLLQTKWLPVTDEFCLLLGTDTTVFQIDVSTV